MLYGFLNTFAFPRSLSLILCNSVFYYFILKRLISGICPLHPQTYDGHSVVYLCLPSFFFVANQSLLTLQNLWMLLKKGNWFPDSLD